PLGSYRCLTATNGKSAAAPASKSDELASPHATYRSRALKAITMSRLVSLALAFELERDLHLRAICFDLSILELHVLFQDLRDPEISQGFAGHIDRGLRRLFP